MYITSLSGSENEPDSKLADFCRAMDWMMDRAMTHCGVTLSGDPISDADYADDIVVVERDLADITIGL